MKISRYLLTAFLAIPYSMLAQRPDYKPKKFVHDDVPAASVKAPQNGHHTTWLKQNITLRDVDASGKIAVKFNEEVLIRIESFYKNGKREGVLKFYIRNAEDTTRQYLIWEQTYAGNKLNGTWKHFDLAGNLVMVSHHKNDSLHGNSTEYLPDGVTRISEVEYFNGRQKQIQRQFEKGRLIMEMPMYNDLREGIAKRFYENGVVMEEQGFRKDLMEGDHIYYYPDGKPWIHEIYKNDKPWKIVANYDSKGAKRAAGTLANGNGTVIYYDSDTVIRQTVTYENGEKVE